MSCEINVNVSELKKLLQLLRSILPELGDFGKYLGLSLGTIEASFKAYEKSLKEGLIPAGREAEAAAKALADGFKGLADSAQQWADKSTNGGLAKKYAQEVANQYASKANSLSDAAVSASDRLKNLSEGVNAKINSLFPKISGRVGGVFDKLDIGASAIKGDMAGVYSGIASMLASDLAAAAAVALAATAGLASAPALAIVAGLAVLATGLAGDIKFGSDGLGLWDKIGKSLKELQDAGLSWLKENLAQPICLDDSPGINTNYRDATNYTPPRRDPLAIDLDNDGIETTGINTAAPLLFDHNADGLKTATGWLKGDDAWLVMDRPDANGVYNGTIDTGRELFGIDTLITDAAGVTRNARDGFEALLSLDANGDKVFDAKDGAAFTKVQLWQDLNQDGISQANELSSLSAKGITAIGLAATSTNTQLGTTGNLITAKATVTRQIGSNTTTSEIDAVSVGIDNTVANLELASNPFYSEFAPLALSDTAKALPNMGGSGNVRNLRDAMSLADASNANFITRSLMKTASQNLTATVTAFAAAKTRDEQRALLDTLVQQWGATGSLTSGDVSVEMSAPGDPFAKSIKTFSETNPELFKKIVALEQFNGSVGLSTVLTRFGATLPAPVVASFEAAYGALRESVYQALVVQTRLQPYLNAIAIGVNDQGIYFDTSGMDALLEARKAADTKNALIDLVELSQLSGETLRAVGMDNINTLRIWVDALPANSPLRSTLASMSVFSGSAPSGGTSGTDIYLGNSSNNGFFSGEGNDSLSGGNGNDALDGDGGADELDGGTGNDTLEGGAGADTYIFGKGYGQDLIYNVDSDALGTNADTILLGTGIGTNDVKLQRSYDNLIIEIIGTGDSLTVSNYFNADGTSGNVVENLKFADGTVWDVPTIKTKVLVGTAENDTLYGYATNDAINGSGGNDRINGYAGDDVLDGGAGNDYLSGGTGADTYVFGKGSGQDTIYNYYGEGLGTNADTIFMREGIRTDGVTLTRNADDLIIRIVDAGDRVTVRNYFNSEGTSTSAVENLNFADGTVWDIDTIKTKVLAGTAGKDTLYGYADEDMLDGGAGADTIQGGAGNDTLDGGTGNDTLSGGTGADTYIFTRGSGQDVIRNYEPLGTKADIILLDKGITTNSVTLTRNYNSLVICINDTSDSLTIENHFELDGASSSAVESLKFADGTVWDMATIKTRVLAATSGDDALYGYASKDNINGSSGNDAIYGYAGDDMLNGSAGVDSIDGGAGNDTLDGGTGNDSLSGGTGADTYIFGKGSGQDTINNYDDDALGTSVDTILLGAGITDTGVSVTRSSNDLTIRIIDTGDRLTVERYFDAEGASSYVVENLKFADGAVWNYSKVKSSLSTALPPGSVTIKGTSDSERLTGGAGDDAVLGDAGSDTLDGGIGNDYLRGDTGADTYIFGKGSGQDIIANYDGEAIGTNPDTILLGAGITSNSVTLTRKSDDLIIGIIDTSDSLKVQNYFYANGASSYTVENLKFTDGSVWDVATVKTKVLTATLGKDTIYGYAADDVLQGSAGEDSIEGRAGNDTLDGGTGNDVLSGGTGADTYIFGKGSGQDRISNFDGEALGTNPDTILLGPGVTPDGVTLSRYFDDLMIGIIDTSDSLCVQGYFQSNCTTSYVVENIKFADSTVWSLSTVKNKMLAATSGDDILYGFDGNEALDGGMGDDALNGVAGNDTLNGGTGNDVLSGGTGADTYIFGKGSGQDRISNADGEALGTNPDTILLGEGITPNGVTLKRSGYDLIIGIMDATDSLTVQSYFEAEGTSSYLVENIKFADGTVWDLAKIKTKVLAATESDDTLYGYASSDTINGGGGNDTIYGGGGNDMLIGGAGADYISGDGGNDTIDGGTGNDTILGAATYLFGKGSGQDSISYVDTILLGEGITTDGVTVATRGSDLILRIIDTSDSLNVGDFKNSYNPPSSAEVNLKFADGTVWDAAAIKTKILAGTSGDDTIYGYAGDDVLSGGSGNDWLTGGLGNNIYVFGKGDGQDFVDGYYDPAVGKLNTLQIKAGVASSEVQLKTVYSNYWSSNSALEVSIAGTLDKVTIIGFSQGNSAGNPIQQIQFADGSKWSTSDITLLLNAASTSGTVDADNLTGTASSDKIYAALGNDTVSGLAGADFLFAGQGNDSLDGGADNDWLYGEAGDDTLVGGLGVDTMAGGSDSDTYYVDNTADVVIEQSTEADYGGIDTIYSSISYTAPDHVETMWLTGSANVNLAGNDWGMSLNGNAGANRIRGGEWEDTLMGGAGADTLEGGYGSDLYFLLNSGDGQDTLVEVADDPYSIDIVWAYANNVRMGDHVEQMVLQSNKAVTAYGGNTDNVITGNGIGNVLYGMGGNDMIWANGGNDTLIGGAGNDGLIGSVGSDTYIFNAGDGIDSITDTSKVANEVDTLAFGGSITANQLWFSRVGSGLRVNVVGTNDQVTINGWYQSRDRVVENITTTGNGKVLAFTKVDALVNAMAAFAPPVAGANALSQADRNKIDAVIAANWA